MQNPIPRVIPKDFSKLSNRCEQILNSIPGDGLKGKYAPVNVLGTLMHAENILEDFLKYWVNSKNKMSLSVREQELIILRMALHYNCNYVWKHHVPVATEFSVLGEELNKIKKYPLESGFSEREMGLITFTDEMVINKNIDDLTWNKFENSITKENVLDLIHLISQYVLFALTNNVFNVRIESSLNDICSLKN